MGFLSMSLPFEAWLLGVLLRRRTRRETLHLKTHQRAAIRGNR